MIIKIPAYIALKVVEVGGDVAEFAKAVSPLAHTVDDSVFSKLANYADSISLVHIFVGKLVEGKDYIESSAGYKYIGK